jgi:hypothetical protein
MASIFLTLILTLPQVTSVDWRGVCSHVCRVRFFRCVVTLTERLEL